MNFYDLARGLHIIAVIAWVAGMLVLPRFYAYQTEAAIGGETDQAMAKAAKSLSRIILTPALLAVWALGLYMAQERGLWTAGWFHAKLLFVLGLSGVHGYFIAAGRKLANGERKHGSRYWRLWSEIPFLVAIAAVLLATLEPF